MLRTDAEPGGVDGAVTMTFFRHESGSDPWAVDINCDPAWITFVRSPECPPTESSGAVATRVPNVTIVTQLTSDRQWMLGELASRCTPPR